MIPITIASAFGLAVLCPDRPLFLSTGSGLVAEAEHNLDDLMSVESPGAPGAVAPTASGL